MTWLIIIIFTSVGVTVDHIPASSMEQCKVMAEQHMAKRPWWSAIDSFQAYCLNDKDKIERVDGERYTIA